ncbi:hypothetical protein EI77_01731 [Prosthecobacter fusiformis]|uniref:Uncharacterized protein n=1 Tax=Prosthecobacter fusiformis TaxID=48464 RepID=A0A4R7S4B7_9BACT|nr:hypothetical protein EI77_01731 [Prosthecobacter fusiformis]
MHRSCKDGVPFEAGRDKISPILRSASFGGHSSPPKVSEEWRRGWDCRASRGFPNLASPGKDALSLLPLFAAVDYSKIEMVSLNSLITRIYSDIPSKT